MFYVLELFQTFSGHTSTLHPPQANSYFLERCKQHSPKMTVLWIQLVYCIDFLLLFATASPCMLGLLASLTMMTSALFLCKPVICKLQPWMEHVIFLKKLLDHQQMQIDNQQPATARWTESPALTQQETLLQLFEPFYYKRLYHAPSWLLKNLFPGSW